MAQRHSLTAEPRVITGKDTKKLRREGITPGVIYGPVVSEPLSVSVNAKELDRIYTALGPNALINLQVDGGTHTVYMRHLSMDRLKKQPIHIEFFAPNMRVEITTSIPVNLAGEPANTDSVLTRGRETVDVRGLPDALPSTIDVDVSVLAEIEQTILVRDLNLPAGVTVITDPEEMLVKLSAPVMEIEPEVEVTEGELEEAAEAGGTEGAADVPDVNGEATEDESES